MAIVTLDERYDLIAQTHSEPATLRIGKNDEPAIATGAKLDFATITGLNTGSSYCYSWSATRAILGTTKLFLV